MIYTTSRDDIPSLSQWIKNKAAKVALFLVTSAPAEWSKASPFRRDRRPRLSVKHDTRTTKTGCRRRHPLQVRFDRCNFRQSESIGSRLIVTSKNEKSNPIGLPVIPSERASRGISFGGDFRTRRIVVCLRLPKRQARHTPCLGAKLVAKTIINRFSLEFRLEPRAKLCVSNLVVADKTKKHPDWSAFCFGGDDRI